jgi:hypothetical protein
LPQVNVLLLQIAVRQSLEVELVHDEAVPVVLTLVEGLDKLLVGVVTLSWVVERVLLFRGNPELQLQLLLAHDASMENIELQKTAFELGPLLLNLQPLKPLLDPPEVLVQLDLGLDVGEESGKLNSRRSTAHTLHHL